MLFKAPRGTADILPDEQAYWRYIEEKAVAVCKLYGYQRMDTPTFEDAGLFARSVGEGTDIVNKEMYVFKDRSDNELALQPEGTASICRAYLEHGMDNLPQPVKLYYFADIFRYERPQAGRYRQHHQFGCEAIGEASPMLDAEVIQMALWFFKSLGLTQFTLQLNSIGCKQCRPDYLLKLAEYYTPLTPSLCEDCRTRIVKNPLRLLDCKKPGCQAAAEEAPRSSDHLCEGCHDHFEALKIYLEALGIVYGVNHRLVRGLDYYTRTVFEFQPLEGGSQSALGGGGRYDDLITELGGKQTPAIGFATGMERIVLNLKNQGIEVPGQVKPAVFMACMGNSAKIEALKTASDLREAGIPVIVAAGDRSLKAQLRQANSLGAIYAVIIGDDEINEGMVTLRNMGTSEQQVVEPEELKTILGAQE
ncbi:MAG: histidine--tRNA ligase [Chloroflexi bacterium]|nr:histidine--tRNA ligase [Chloroflexota bacterium]